MYILKRPVGKNSPVGNFFRTAEDRFSPPLGLTFFSLSSFAVLNVLASLDSRLHGHRPLKNSRIAPITRLGVQKYLKRSKTLQIENTALIRPFFQKALKGQLDFSDATRLGCVLKLCEQS